MTDSSPRSAGRIVDPSVEDDDVPVEQLSEEPPPISHAGDGGAMSAGERTSRPSLDRVSQPPRRSVPEVVRDYLEAARAAGFREVRLIHGKGIGVQRERVRALLAAHSDVESFADAPAGRGHWGATVVRLRPAD